METLLHYVWKYKLYYPESLITTDGTPISVIDCGIHNTDAGPDFFNAKIKIEDTIWVGNVEMHSYSSDWFRHKHQSDKAYNSVILHVIENPDQEYILTESGRTLPQLILSIPDHIKENSHFLLNKDHSIPCFERISEIPEIFLTDWKNALLVERLERKTTGILKLLDDYQSDWNEAFYITLARNFGFGINNDAFERLARSLPFKFILKHNYSITQVEALLFGQAGLLDNNLEDDYFNSLKKEYQFLKQKFNLQSIPGHIFRNLRIRPANSPHIKIAQLAELIHTQEHLFSKIFETEDMMELRNLFLTNLHPYWLTHYKFGKMSPARKEKKLGMEAQNIILINTVVPILFTYGKKKKQFEWMERAIRLLETIRPENNSISYAYSGAGIKIHHAGDSQSLIQLKSEYCDKKKCIFCRIGHKLLSKQ